MVRSLGNYVVASLSTAGQGEQFRFCLRPLQHLFRGRSPLVREFSKDNVVRFFDEVWSRKWQSQFLEGFEAGDGIINAGQFRVLFEVVDARALGQ